MKPNWRPVWQEVNGVLRDSWLPDWGDSTPEDEFDCCVRPVVSLLFASASPEQFADHLEAHAANHLGSPIPRHVHETCAAKLAAIQIPGRS